MPAFVTFLTAGYPSKASSVPLMLAMQRGGADIIELGIPFSDPIADGPAIQHSNTVALGNDMNFQTCLDQVREARDQGLTAPVLLMGQSCRSTASFRLRLRSRDRLEAAGEVDQGQSLLGIVAIELPDPADLPQTSS